MGMEGNVAGFPWGWNQIFEGTGADGMVVLWGWVGSETAWG